MDTDTPNRTAPQILLKGTPKNKERLIEFFLEKTAKNNKPIFYELSTCDLSIITLRYGIIKIT